MKKGTINLKDFFDKNNLIFSKDKEGVSWVKRAFKPKTLRRIGPNYLVDKKEIEELFSLYVLRQEEIYNMRSIQAKKMSKMTKKKDLKTPNS